MQHQARVGKWVSMKSGWWSDALICAKAYQVWLIKFMAYQHSSCHACKQQDLHLSSPGLVLSPAPTVAAVPWNLCLCAIFVVSRPA